MVMSADQAREILGVSSGSSLDEIERRFKDLAAVSHPDRGGDEGRMRDLIEARDVAKASRDTGVLVPLDAMRELVELLQEPSRELIRHQGREATAATRRRESEAAVSAVVAFSVNRLTRLRRIIEVVAALQTIAIAGVYLAHKNVHSVETPGWYWSAVENHIATWITVGLVLYGVLTALYWGLRAAAQAVEYAVTDVADNLSDPGTYAAVVDEIAETSEHPLPWDRLALIQGVETWVSASRKRALLQNRSRSRAEAWRIAQRAGSDHFVQLLLAKGRENGMLVERKIRGARNQTTFVYELAAPDE
jgi:hypothetical protein